MPLPSFHDPGHQVEPISDLGGADLVGGPIDLLGHRIHTQARPQFRVRSGMDQWLDLIHCRGLQLLDEPEHRVQARQGLICLF